MECFVRVYSKLPFSTKNSKIFRALSNPFLDLLMRRVSSAYISKFILCVFIHTGSQFPFAKIEGISLIKRLKRDGLR